MASPRPRPSDLVVKKASKICAPHRLGHAGTGVADLDDDAVRRLGGHVQADAGLGPALYGVDRVLEQVHDHLFEARPVAEDPEVGGARPLR